MMRLLAALSIAVVVLAGCGTGVPVPPRQADAAIEGRQAQAFVDALKPHRPGRPVIAVVALNEGTETTDFLLSHAILQRAGIAEVRAVAPRQGRVALYPVFEVAIAQDFAGFDREHPSGADYVIVPAMRDDDDPEILAWLRQQADQGARVIGVCAGALVVGRAGLLDGRRFTTHWYYRGTILGRHPGAVYVPHQRYVMDRGVATTTGITGVIPSMLALVEAIGGRDRAQALADELGVETWGPAHDSSRFGLDAARALHYVLSKAAFWRHEERRIHVYDGMDDVALALAADAWSRTGRVSVQASAPGPVTLESGLVLMAEPAAPDTPPLPLSPQLEPARQLDRTLCEIAERFGNERRDWVMMEMEYAGRADACAS